MPVAGVVDDDVQPPEVIMGLRDGGEVGCPVGDVEPDGKDRVTVNLDEVGHGVGIAGGGGDLVAALECCDRPLAAEAARCASDEPHLFAHVIPNCLLQFPREASAKRGPTLSNPANSGLPSFIWATEASMHRWRRWASESCHWKYAIRPADAKPTTR